MSVSTGRGGTGSAASTPPPGRGPGFMRGGPAVGMPVAKAQDSGKAFRRLMALLRPDRHRLAVVILLALIGVSFNVVGPKLLGDATDVIFNGVVSRQLPTGSTKEQAVEALRADGQDQLAEMVSGLDLVPGTGVDLSALTEALTLVVIVYLLAALFTWAQGYIMAGITQRAVYRLREQVDHKIGRLPLRYFDSHSRGDLLSRVTNDIDNINTSLQQALTQSITSLATVLGILGMMLWISPLLALIALITVPASVVVTVLVAKRSRPQFAAQWKWTGTLNGHVEEMFSGQDLVAVYGRREEAMSTFVQANDEVYRASLKAQFISGVIMPATNVIGNLGYVGIAVVGALRVSSGQMTLGEVQAFIQYSRQFTMPISQLAGMANLIQSGIASAERVFELLDAQEQEPDPAVPAVLPTRSSDGSAGRSAEAPTTGTAKANGVVSGRARGHIEFDEIRFGYSPDAPLIENLSLEARPGQTVAIVGPTGAGKTTLVNLLMRFYELDGGQIRLDGVDIAAMNRDDLRRNIGMVLQDTWLFGGTIAENICYGDDSGKASTERMLAAAQAAHVDHLVRTLPDGYDTRLDDEASNLSSGEKQLLTIARAFVADPPILILDEATSSVDTRTEVLVQEAMNRLRSGRTSFVIAHRLSTIRGADTILVMEAGRVVERGSHEDLLAARGAYYDLYNSQFSERMA